MSGTSGNPWIDGTKQRGAAYDRRFQELADTGADVHGEARRIAGYGPRSVLDAGCGTGRVAIELSRRGIDVVGVDLDPAMLAAARAKAPHLRWVHSDLATVDLGRTFDVVVMAGNVVVFLAPGTEAAVVTRMAAHVAGGGLLVAGFALSPGTTGLDAYDRLAERAGLTLTDRTATWEGAAFEPGGDYAVSVHRRVSPEPDGPGAAPTVGP
ncbi:MAG: class I SAM-dependent methyltransferase [Acidimicrobiales bacterium]